MNYAECLELARGKMGNYWVIYNLLKTIHSVQVF